MWFLHIIHGRTWRTKFLHTHNIVKVLRRSTDLVHIIYETSEYFVPSLVVIKDLLSLCHVYVYMNKNSYFNGSSSNPLIRNVVGYPCRHHQI